MILDQRLSTENLPAPLLPPRDAAFDPLLNYELGGAGLNDSSQGLQVKSWTGARVGNQIQLSTVDVPPTTIVTDAGITELHFTFDQTMRPFICWVAGGQAKYYWYDTVAEQFDIEEMASDVRNPRCTLDDKRPGQTGASDIILAYLRGASLYFRAQRDRYTIEYHLADGIAELVNVGMGANNRLQFAVYLIDE